MNNTQATVIHPQSRADQNNTGRLPVINADDPSAVPGDHVWIVRGFHGLSPERIDVAAERQWFTEDGFPGVDCWALSFYRRTTMAGTFAETTFYALSGAQLEGIAEGGEPEPPAEVRTVAAQLIANLTGSTVALDDGEVPA